MCIWWRKKLTLAAICDTSTTYSTERVHRRNWRACAGESNTTAESICLQMRSSKNIEGSIGNFKTRFWAGGDTTEITHGVVIVATGAKQYQPNEYLYGQDNRVITQRELEARLVSDDSFLAKEPNQVGKDSRHDPVRGIARR